MWLKETGIEERVRKLIESSEGGGEKREKEEKETGRGEES